VKTIGIVTSGGDAPGMNAAIRAITRIAQSRGINVIGFEKGWEGVLTNKHRHLTTRSVGGIIQLGGTILHTSRSLDFKKDECLEQAADNLNTLGVEGLVVIGGDGSFRAAMDLSKKSKALMVGIPATIDNDVYGTDETIGFDTAVNTAVAEIDKIRDTAISHERIFIVEVMGRKRGFLAITVGISVGAEVILVPEDKCKMDHVVSIVKENARKGKRAGIIVAAEGCGNINDIAREIEEKTGSEVRLSILGYAQRGGSPTARSRLLASLFSEKAVDLLCQGKGNMVAVFQNGIVTATELEKVSCGTKSLDFNLMKLAETLAT
jgi:6-phosphofructokinase 1